MEILSIAPPAGFPAQHAALSALSQRPETPASEALKTPSEEALSKLRGLFDRPAGEEEMRPAEIGDLRRLQAYLAEHDNRAHPFNLSDEITLSPHSPMPRPTATVEQVMNYYSGRYPRLLLPDPPKTLPELISYNRLLGAAIHANQSLTDAVDQAFDAALRELTGKIERLTDKQEVRQAEIRDLRQVQAYLTSHSDEKNPFNLSEQITLSPNSPMAVATATVEQVMAHYRHEYPELSLPDPPKTLSELLSYNKVLGDAIQLTLAPGSRLSMVALQDYVSRLHAMRDFQGSVYRALYDMRKQYVRGM